MYRDIKYFIFNTQTPVYMVGSSYLGYFYSMWNVKMWIWIKFIYQLNAYKYSNDEKIIKNAPFISNIVHEHLKDLFKGANLLVFYLNLF